MSDNSGNELREKCNVYFIGGGNLLCEALMTVLQRELGAICTCRMDASEVAQDLRNCRSKVALVLIDSATSDYEAALSDIGAIGSGGSCTPVAALYNLQPGTGVEKRAFTRGIHGFFYHNDTLDHVLRGIKALLKGELWMSRTLLVNFALMSSAKDKNADRKKPLLTQRETQIIALVSVGASNEEIADRLTLSPHTVKTHLYNLFRKINVPNRFQAALWAAKNL